ncbi:MAG: DUF5605 domain-containing protein [Oscillospiraceae bacterium]|nr:DUF5605 domain-containing protein [Oscillospiraceae bacterium]MDD4369107.1 DUF5605 domain-containing protein [Oscillospiraceae bacterium]
MTVTLQYPRQVERWGRFEITLPGPAEGNPFLEQTLTASFSSAGGGSRTVEGFYDGDGCYRLRYLPRTAGPCHFELSASFLTEPIRGSFMVTPQATPGNHGPVHVADTYYLAYEDGTPYHCVGTTCYAWVWQSEQRRQSTLKALAAAPFNKLRFCALPKHYVYNLTDPPLFPFPGTPMDASVLTEDNFNEYNGCPPGNHWDFSRFNPAYFQQLEQCIASLCNLGIEADLIVLHPYDRWGFSQMDPATDQRYWRYLIARLACYRNLWWSLANEYDLLPRRNLTDWERDADLLCRYDPYGHLRSIHNCFDFYDYSRPWITHCSIQRQNLYLSGELTNQWRERWHKPVVLDEIAYEGDIQFGWGNLSGEEMTRRCWETVCRGGYAGHGETYLIPDGILWWSHGGTLHGSSPARLAFLRRIMEETPGPGLEPWPEAQWDEVAACAHGPARQDYFIFYYSFMRPGFRDFNLGPGRFQIEVIDTWNMTITPQGYGEGRFRVRLPARPYMAVRLRRR